MVLKLKLEPLPGSPVLLALVEHLADVSGERHKVKEMLLKELLAFFRAASSENAASRRQLDGAVFEFSELQDVQGCRNREKVVDLEGNDAAILASSAAPP